MRGGGGGSGTAVRAVQSVSGDLEAHQPVIRLGLHCGVGVVVGGQRGCEEGGDAALHIQRSGRRRGGGRSTPPGRGRGERQRSEGRGRHQGVGEKQTPASPHGAAAHLRAALTAASPPHPRSTAKAPPAGGGDKGQMAAKAESRLRMPSAIQWWTHNAQWRWTGGRGQLCGSGWWVGGG